MDILLLIIITLITVIGVAAAMVGISSLIMYFIEEYNDIREKY